MKKICLFLCGLLVLVGAICNSVAYAQHWQNSGDSFINNGLTPAEEARIKQQASQVLQMGLKYYFEKNLLVWNYLSAYSKRTISLQIAQSLVSGGAVRGNAYEVSYMVEKELNNTSGDFAKKCWATMQYGAAAHPYYRNGQIVLSDFRVGVNKEKNVFFNYTKGTNTQGYYAVVKEGNGYKLDLMSSIQASINTDNGYER